METWRFFDITHRQHVICNPSSLEKYQQLIDLLPLAPGATVLEIAMGKGEFIIRLAEQRGINGVGVDISPYCVRDARTKLAARAPDAHVTFLQMDGADYQPDEPESFDLAVCLGASWIFDGHAGTLAGLHAMTRPGGRILVGEPYWRQEPDPDYLRSAGFERSQFGTHYANVMTGQDLGLTLLYTIVSTLDEWDRYVGLRWLAAEDYAQAHPQDPDAPELLERVRHEKQDYLRWGRDTLGWALYLFRK
ncbi:MAG: class I SAM-dependent methyltransferase [Chloroflexota bacterium]|jgi:SAM-dependent methyltransferase